MEVKILKRKNKKPGYGLKKIYGAVIQKKGRILADLTDDIEFKEEDKDGNIRISFR
jgi:hypothetical protein